jgi:large subunit ribosomal protein L3
MAYGLMGKKVGMTQVFDHEGQQVPVTIIEVSPNRVIQVKRSDGKDGYAALKLGFEDIALEKLNRPDRGVFHRAGVEPTRYVHEFRVASDDVVAEISPGEALDVTIFSAGEKVDVTGTSKGKGYQGVVKRHGFKGAKEASHGTHEHKRHAGSIGCSADPARVIKGKRMPGQMGGRQVTTRGLQVVAIYPNDNLLLIKGAVPGAKQSLVTISPSLKN